VERGTHESLYAARGRYYDLYTRQHGIDANLFLAPGEGGKEPEAEEKPRMPGTAGAGVAAPTAASLLRGGIA
jgi:subfamily B ATP-binding cassette protein MsbA